MRRQIAGLNPSHLAINGEQLAVVAAVHVGTWPGEAPTKLVVITCPEGDVLADSALFAVHYTHLERRDDNGDHWEAYQGSYRLTWQAALAELVTRATEKGPAPMAIHTPFHIV